MSFINGKIGLITGGASGIGFLTVKELLKGGIKGIVIAEVNEGNGKKAVQELTEEFGANRVVFIKTDVTRFQEVEAAFLKTIEIFKNLDIIVNSAGILNDSVWQKEVTVNLNGTIHVCLLGFDKYLHAHKTGNEAFILNVSFTLALVDAEPWPIYAATKNAVIGLSKSLGTENHYKRTKVRVLTLCPGASNTPILVDLKGSFIGPHYEELAPELFAKHPLQRPENVAKGIVRAIEEGRNGSVWVTNEGRTCEVKIPDLFTLLEN